MNDQTKIINFSRTPKTPEDFLQILEIVHDAFNNSDALHTDIERGGHTADMMYNLKKLLTYLDGAFKKAGKANVVKVGLKYNKDFFNNN